LYLGLIRFTVIILVPLNKFILKYFEGALLVINLQLILYVLS